MRICFLGDSLVNGTGDDDGLGWVGRLCAAERRRAADLTVYNLGIRRDTSADIRRRWRREAAARLPPGCDGRLVFAFGLNDCAPGSGGEARVAVDKTVENTRRMLAGARAWLPTLMVGPPPVTDSPARNEAVALLSGRIQEICGRLGVPFFSTAPFARANYATWRAEAERGDGIHPNVASYAALADAIRGWDAWRAWFETGGQSGAGSEMT